jgi:hypothetical protein
VTPFSIPVLARALHALLVIAARHLGQVRTPSEFRSGNEGVRSLVERIAARSADVDSEHSGVVASRLQDLVRHWETLGPEDWGGFGDPPENCPLLYPAGTPPRAEWEDLAWSTPSSLRNVDVECSAQVRQIYRTS